MKKKKAQWEPPPLDPRKFHDPYRKKKPTMVKSGPGIRQGQIMRRASDGILYIAS